MADFTFQLDSKRTAIKVTDRKQRAREIFLERGQLPSEGGSNPLLDLYNDNYAVEIFYFPASSLDITNVLRYFLQFYLETVVWFCAPLSFFRVGVSCCCC